MLHWFIVLTRRNPWVRFGMAVTIGLGAVALWRPSVPGNMAPPGVRGTVATPLAGPGYEWLVDLRQRITALVAEQRETYTQALHSWETLADRLGGERR